MTLLTKEEVTKARIEALARVYQKADRVLTGDRIVVQAVEGTGKTAPAWTDGNTITFNLSKIDSATSVDDLIRLTGLNYHELGHAMFTPRQGSRLAREVMSKGWFDAFNILEDQRLETFLTVMYPSTVPYFTATFMRYCTQDQRSWDGNFLLMYGRKYLPKKVRDEFRARFTSPHLIPEAERIIDRYRELVFPRDDQEGLALIEAFVDVLRKHGKTPDDPNGHSTNGRPIISRGNPVTQQEQQEAADNIDAWDDYYDDDTDDDGNGAEDDAEDGEGEPGKGDSKGDSDDDDTDDDGTGNGDGDAEGDDADDIEDGNGSADSEGEGEGEGEGSSSTAPPSHQDGEQEEAKGTSKGKGTGTGKDASAADPLSDDDLKALLEQAARDAETLPEVIEEVKRKQDTIRNGDGDVDTHLPSAPFTTMHPDEVHLSTVRRLAHEFRQLQADSDPGYKPYRSSGRISIQRVITGGVDFETMFDEWDEGQQDATDIEAVITVDISGSMMGSEVETSLALWAVKRALEDVDASVSVFAFNGSPFKLYGRDEVADRTSARIFSARGNTDPAGTILEAMRIFNASRRTHKLFIAITDGGWSYGSVMGMDNDTAIQRMNDNGITTATAYIGGLSEADLVKNGYGHNCQIVVPIDKPEHLVGWAREVVKQMAKNVRLVH